MIISSHSVWSYSKHFKWQCLSAIYYCLFVEKKKKEDPIKGGKVKRKLAHDTIFFLTGESQKSSLQDEFSFLVLKAFQQRAWHTDVEELALVNCISSITVRCLTVLCPLNCDTISFLYFSM